MQMAEILYPRLTDHTTGFIQNSLDLVLESKRGNTFQFIPKGCLQKLEEACNSETIKDLLQCLAEDARSAERFGKGDFELCFAISMSHHRNYYSVNTRKEILSLSSQELDPDELVEDIKSVGIFGEKDKDELMDCMPREQRIGFLLGRLVGLKGADEGFKFLLDHCKRYNYKRILYEKKDLYTAKVILSIGMKEATEVSDNRNVPEITSVHIQDSESYFDTIAEDVVPIEIHMKLEPALETTIEDVDDAVVDHENDMELAHDGDTTRDEAVQMDPDVPEDDRLVGTNFNGDQGEKTENHLEPLTSDVKEFIENISAYQRKNLEFISWLQQKRLKTHDEDLEKHVKRDQEFMDMIEQMSKEGV